MSNKTDIVYALGNGSLHDNAELRYSLRSVEKHVQDAGNIYIVGERPEWLQNIIHIPAADVSQKETNIKNKILAACAIPTLSRYFLFMNDDHFFIKDIVAGQYPYYHKGSLQAHVESRYNRGMVGGYYQTLLNTHKVLTQRRLPALHFDIHTPILYSKIDFPVVAKQYNWSVFMSLTIKSIYCNTLKIKGERIADCRINTLLKEDEIKHRIANRNVFSIGDDGYNNAMQNILNEFFPNKSKYEL